MEVGGGANAYCSWDRTILLQIEDWLVNCAQGHRGTGAKQVVVPFSETSVPSCHYLLQLIKGAMRVEVGAKGLNLRPECLRKGLAL